VYIKSRVYITGWRIERYKLES